MLPWRRRIFFDSFCAFHSSCLIADLPPIVSPHSPAVPLRSGLLPKHVGRARAGRCHLHAGRVRVAAHAADQGADRQRQAALRVGRVRDHLHSDLPVRLDRAARVPQGV